VNYAVQPDGTIEGTSQAGTRLHWGQVAVAIVCKRTGARQRRQQQLPGDRCFWIGRYRSGRTGGGVQLSGVR